MERGELNSTVYFQSLPGSQVPTFRGGFLQATNEILILDSRHQIKFSSWILGTKLNSLSGFQAPNKIIRLVSWRQMKFSAWILGTRHQLIFCFLTPDQIPHAAVHLTLQSKKEKKLFWIFCVCFLASAAHQRPEYSILLVLYMQEDTIPSIRKTEKSHATVPLTQVQVFN